MQITTGYEIPMPHQRLIIEKYRKMSKLLKRISFHKASKICRQNSSSLTNCKLVVNPVRALKFSMSSHFFDTAFFVNHKCERKFRCNMW